MNLRAKLRKAFQRRRYRHAYVESFLDSYIATQIRVLREQRGWTQEELANEAELKQSQISALENVNRSNWTTQTLNKLARAFDLALVVRFDSFGAVLRDIDTFDRASLERVSFGDDWVFKGVHIEVDSSTREIQSEPILEGTTALQESLAANRETEFSLECVGQLNAA